MAAPRESNRLKRGSGKSLVDRKNSFFVRQGNEAREFACKSQFVPVV